MNRCFQKCTKKSRFGLLHPTSPCTLNSILSFAHAAYSISYQSVSDNVLLSIVVFMWEVLWVTKPLLTSALTLHTFIVCINNWKVATCLFKLTGPSSSKNAAEFLFKNSLRSYLFLLKMGEISVWLFWLLWKISGPPLLSPKVWPFLRTKMDWKMFKLLKLIIYTQMHKKCLSWNHRAIIYSSL